MKSKLVYFSIAVAIICHLGFASLASAAKYSATVEKHVVLLDVDGVKRNVYARELSDYLRNLPPAEIPFVEKVLDGKFADVKKTIDSIAPQELMEINSTGGVTDTELAKFGVRLAKFLNETESNIDQAKKEMLMSEMDQCSNSKDPDIASLYEALSEIASDKRCNIDTLKVKETYRTRGFSFGCKTIRIDPAASGISGGVIDLSADGGATTNTLKFDANHFTKMSKDDWLNGLQAHEGFRSQLSRLGFCKDTKASAGSLPNAIPADRLKARGSGAAN